MGQHTQVSLELQVCVYVPDSRGNVGLRSGLTPVCAWSKDAGYRTELLIEQDRLTVAILSGSRLVQG